MNIVDKKNYPAAHSMDSYWFGVDLDGNIGVFDTGESGPIPNNAKSSVDGFWFLLKELEMDSEGIRHFYMPKDSLNEFLTIDPLLEISERVYHSYVIENKKIPDFFFNDIVLQFENKEAFSCVNNEGFTVKLDDQMEIYYLGRPKPQDILDLLNINAIVGSILNFTDSEIIAKISQSFYYEEKSQYTHGRGVSDYKRVSSPEKPMKIDQLPDELKEKFSFKLPLLFTENELIQPLEYTKGSATETYYINSKGEKVDTDYGE